MSSVLVFEAVRNTFGWALLSTVVVVVPGTALAYLLARAEFAGKALVATLVSLPLVLPPTAVGYLLLSVLADDGWLGSRVLGFDLHILLTWRAVVLACAVMSFPLFVRTARVSFEAVSPRYALMARTLGYGEARIFLTITLPLAGRGLAAATILAFTRALGEFGATVIIAGNIPGQTQTLASAIYSAQQAGAHGEANLLLAVALVAGFVAVFAAEWLTRPRQRVGRRTGS